jgi:hypothetical protein
MQTDALNVFVAGLEARAGVNVNQAMLQQILGGAQPQ